MEKKQMWNITLTTNGFTEKVKMKSYTTNCRKQIQCFGKHEVKKHLGNEHTPKYFANKFIVPFLKSVVEKSLEFEKFFIPHLKQEIQRLQKKKIQDKTNKGPAIESESKTAKSENSNCQHKSTVMLKNVTAYGSCAHCKGFDHFHCAGTSKIINEDIKAGLAIFICTNCIQNNPALGKEISISNPSTLTVKVLISSPQEENISFMISNPKKGMSAEGSIRLEVLPSSKNNSA